MSALTGAAVGGPIADAVATFRPRNLSGATSASGIGARALSDLALDALARSFSKTRGSIAGLPPTVIAALSARLPADLDPQVTMPHIHDERYWKRACEEGHGWRDVDISRHGFSWKQVSGV